MGPIGDQQIGQPLEGCTAIGVGAAVIAIIDHRHDQRFAILAEADASTGAVGGWGEAA